jgi:hypothetical protein
LPPLLIARLRAAEKKINPRLGLMKNLDPRSEYYGKKPPSRELTYSWPERLRGMGVSRTFPGTKLVLKRPHEGSAQGVIDAINKKVESYNRDAQPKEFELMAPICYAIGDKIIAMAETRAPTLEQVLEGTSKRDVRFRKVLSRKGLTLPVLQELFSDVTAKFWEGNVFFFLEKGKPVLVAMPDWY